MVLFWCNSIRTTRAVQHGTNINFIRQDKKKFGFSLFLIFTNRAVKCIFVFFYYHCCEDNWIQHKSLYYFCLLLTEEKWNEKQQEFIDKVCVYGNFSSSFFFMLSLHKYLLICRTNQLHCCKLHLLVRKSRNNK